MHYYHHGKKAVQAFESIDDPPGVDLTVIVPAYNEEERLPGMLQEAVSYLEDRQKMNVDFTYEVIVVNDGSKDKTTKVVLDCGAKFGSDKIKVLTLEKNRGKGGAIKLGVLCSRGRRLLFADADAATRFSDLMKLDTCLSQIEQRSFLRTVLMKGFHLLVWFLCVRSVRDTQCGFKLFTRATAKLLFRNLHVDRWAFDVDLLYQAEYHRIPIGEVAVKWQEIDGSKITPFWSWLQMGRDLLLVSLRYKLGAWKLQPQRLKTD